jgi:hypothetical protein
MHTCEIEYAYMCSYTAQESQEYVTGGNTYHFLKSKLGFKRGKAAKTDDA